MNKLASAEADDAANAARQQEDRSRKACIAQAVRKDRRACWTMNKLDVWWRSSSVPYAAGRPKLNLFVCQQKSVPIVAPPPMSQARGWESTLMGLPKELYDAWAKYFRPRGYKLRAEIVQFSGDRLLTQHLLLGASYIYGVSVAAKEFLPCVTTACKVCGRD